MADPNDINGKGQVQAIKLAYLIFWHFLCSNAEKKNLYYWNKHNVVGSLLIVRDQLAY